MNALKMNALKRFYYRHKKITDFKPHVKKSKRSFWGNVILGLFLIALASLFFFPVLYMISQSLKPMNEMFIFPPKIWVENPTLDIIGISLMFWQIRLFRLPDICTIPCWSL